MTSYRRVLALIIAFASGSPAAEPEYDLIITDGLVYDGSGGPAVRADVAISAGRIARVGPLAAASARRRIDATGLAVAPGFIDLHTHIDAILRMPDAENFLRQGVTTVVGGADGYSPWPLAPQLARLAQAPLGPNVSYLVGHIAIRRAVMKIIDRAPIAAELAAIAAHAEQEMKDGGFGLSTGLSYSPGSPKTNEIIVSAQVAARHGGFYSTHVRNEGLGVIAAVEEALQIGREAGLPVVLTHHKVAGRSMWGASAKTLALVDAARAAGQDVMLDQYPYTASSTSLFTIMPPWALAGGREAFQARVADADQRARIKREIVHSILTDGGGGDIGRIQFAGVPWKRDLEGRTLRDWCVERGLELSPESGAELIIEAQLAGGAACIFHVMAEGDVERIMRHPQTMIASDGRLSRPGDGHPHPRCYGTFPRVLGLYVREKNVLPLETAIHKMTQMPARRMGLHDRGRVAAGCAADLVVFDPATVRDAATFEAPHQYPVGIPYVIVNGAVTVDSGVFTSARGGGVLRRATARR